ncbi:MAG: ABC transporter permease [Spirochaetales bacterium]|nr:ABC transporter permease [Spirochaetales bacterium]
MRKLLAIARREFRATAANKTFVIMTLLGPFLILAVSVLPGLLSNTPGALNSGKPMAMMAPNPMVAQTLAPALEAQGYASVSFDDAAAAKEGVLAGDYAGFIEVPAAWPDEEARYYSVSATEISFFSGLEAILGGLATSVRVGQAGLTQEQAALLNLRPEFSVVKLGAGGEEEQKGAEDFMGILFTALGFVMLIYMTVLLYGQMIGRSVVQEKTNKTVEVMLSSVSSRQLMFGKILGLGLAGLLQYAVWMGMATALIHLIGPAMNVSLPASISMANFGWLVLFFVLAFFLYAGGYAALGAAAEDEHHLGQLAWPLLVFLIVPLVLISPMVMNPGSPIVVALSYFPMTSPIVMLVRLLVSTPAWWELALCLGLLAITVYGMAVLAAKIFRVGILMSGKRPSFGEVLRWARVR